MLTDLALRTRLAHGDAWQAEGRLREPYGGGTAELPGVRLMASGVPQAQWNNGDVDDPTLVDVENVREWYAGRAPTWGLRVPAGVSWHAGRRLFVKRLMGLPAGEFRPAPTVAGLTVRAAAAADLPAVLDVDAEAFAEDPQVERPWIEPHLTAAVATVAVAELEGRPVGTAYTIRTDDRAGACVYLAGVAVVVTARRRGIAGALSSWLLARGFAAGAEFAHLHPDTDLAARVYGRLGFTEVPGFDVYVEL